MITDMLHKGKLRAEFLFDQSFSRDEVIAVIQKVYYFEMKENVPIFCVQTPNLAKYTTTQDDFKKRQNKRPPAN